MPITAGTAFINILPNMEGFAAKLKTGVTAAGSKLGPLSPALTAGLTAGIAAAGVAAAKLAIDFEASMSKIQGLVGVSKTQVDAWGQDILKLSPELGVAPKELADALFFVTSAGFRGAAAMDVLKASAEAATAGLGDTATVADAVTSAVNSYGQGALSATRATDIMVAAVREGKLPPEQLASVLGGVLPIASQMGVTFDQVAAAIASATRQGLNAARAATSVRFLLSAFIKPSGAATKALDSVGLSAEDLQKSLQSKGLLPTMQLLAKRFDLATASGKRAFAEIVGGARGMTIASILVGKNGEAIEKIFHNVDKSAGSTAKAFEVAKKTTAFALKSLRDTIEVVAIEIGQALLPVIVSVGRALEGLFKILGFLLRPITDFVSGLAEIKLGGISVLGVVVGGYGLIFALKKLSGVTKLLGATTAATAAETGAAAAAIESEVVATESLAVTTAEAEGTMAAFSTELQVVAVSAVEAEGTMAQFAFAEEGAAVGAGLASRAVAGLTGAFTALWARLGPLAAAFGVIHVIMAQFSDRTDSVNASLAAVAANLEKVKGTLSPGELTKIFDIDTSGLHNSIHGIVRDFSLGFAHFGNVLKKQDVFNAITKDTNKMNQAFSDFFATNVKTAKQFFKTADAIKGANIPLDVQTKLMQDLTSGARKNLEQYFELHVKSAKAFNNTAEAIQNSNLPLETQQRLIGALDQAWTRHSHTLDQASSDYDAIGAATLKASNILGGFTSVNQDATSAISSVTENLKKLGRDATLGQTQAALQPLRDAWDQWASDTAASINTVIGSLSDMTSAEHISAAKIASNLDKELTKTKEFGRNLVKISNDGTKGAKALVQQLIAAGPAGQHMAAVIANATPKVRKHIEEDIGKSLQTSQRFGQTLEDKLTAGFDRIAAAILIATGKAKSFEDALNQLQGKHVSATVDITATFLRSGGGGFKGQAEGGDVEAGVPYTVGERGVELFVPKTDGTIVPHHALHAMRSAARHSGHWPRHVKLVVGSDEFDAYMLETHEGMH